MLLRSAAVLSALLLGACAEATPPADDPPASDVGQTIRGVVSPGVEAGCTVLNAGERQYLLLGAEDELPESGEVVLRGQAQPDLMTTCQEGVPFAVEEVVEVLPTRT